MPVQMALEQKKRGIKIIIQIDGPISHIKTTAAALATLII